MKKTPFAVAALLVAAALGLALSVNGTRAASSAHETAVMAAAATEATQIDSSESAHNWPQWRGPGGNGVAPHGDPPVEFSESDNVAWKIAIPGTGSATPIVWGDHLYVLSAVPAAASAQAAAAVAPTGHGGRNDAPDRAHRFTVSAIDRMSGEVAWQQVAREEMPHESKHPTGTWASTSAVTDGERLYAFFGSRGLFTYSLDGEPLWERDLGDMSIRLGFGEGASPALADGKVVVPWDHEGDSFIVALNAATGDEVWRQPRDEITSWSTPLIVPNPRNGGHQVVTGATGAVRSYDLETGELLWHGPGLTLNPIPSPVAGNGMVFLTSGFRGNALMAVRLADAAGDIAAGSAIAWRHDRDTPYVPSPLLYDDELYFLKSNSGVLTALDAKSGDLLYGPVRVPGIQNVYASPTAAAGRIYIADREGNITVIERGAELKVLATNTLDDGFDASPVIVDGELYLRGRTHLYRISAKSD